MNPEGIHAADRLAFDRAMVAEPVWNGLESAKSAAGIPPGTLLHAGPAFAGIDSIPAPVMNSACVAVVYEGLAADFDSAERLIRSEEIALSPAQDKGVVVPLAAVVSASMPLHAVYDAHGGQVRAFAPINGGSGPSLRLGLRSKEVLEHIRWLNDGFADALERGLAEGIALLPLASESIRRGDDCHGRTGEATAMLLAEMQERTPGGIKDARALEFARSSPSLFLNLWMAATKCALRAGEGVDGSSLLTAAAGNGTECGIQLSGMPGRWFTAPAPRPAGSIEGGLPAERALGAIGDSAIVDAFGLGAMAFEAAPKTAEAFAEFLPSDASGRRSALTLAPHVAFRGVDLKLGVSGRRAAAAGAGPFVSLGMIDSSGELGRIGAGILDSPAEPFEAALAALEGEPTCQA